MYSLDDAEIRAFLLEGTQTGKLGYRAADGRPLVAPVWFVIEGGRLVFNTAKDTAKGRALARDPRVAAGGVGDDAPALVRRAVRLIISGVLDDANEAAIGARLGVSARHLRRMFNDHLGVTPDQFARSRRAHFAQCLLDDSDLSIAE